LLGQVEALAMWTLRGQLHRLIRASFLVAGVVAVAAAQAYFTERNYARMLGLYTFAAMVMLLATAIADSFRARRVRSKAEVEPSPVRFPLVELFGWTIVVAIGSFFARWIEGRYFPDSSRQIQEAASVLLTPIALAVLVKRDLRELSQTTATLVMLVFVGSLAWITIINHGQFDVTLALCCQGAYLAAWLTVQSIEHIQQEAARLREDACKLQ
jgi:hypothetical protein